MATTPKHRAPRPTVASVKAELDTEAEERQNADSGLDGKIEELRAKLATRDGDFKESLKQARQAFAKNASQDRAISRLHVIAHTHEEQMTEMRAQLSRIEQLAQAGGSINERRAESKADGLGDDIDKAFEATDKQIEDLRKHVDDEVTRLDGRIDDHEKAVDERFGKEREATNESIEKNKPKDSEGLPAVKGDVAKLSQRVDRHRTYINKRPSYVVPAAVGFVVGVVVFLIVFVATVFNFPLAFLCGVGFGSLAAGLACVIIDARRKELVDTTESRRSSQKKHGLAGLFNRDDDDDDDSEDDTDTRPADRQREPARSSH